MKNASLLCIQKRPRICGGKVYRKIHLTQHIIYTKINKSLHPDLTLKTSARCRFT